jgi:dihydropteroate synthase
MNKIYTKFFDSLEIGDDFPTIIMGVLNLSPESFYKSSVFDDLKSLKSAALNMINNGAKMLDLGARSTAPWSKKITVEEEINRITPAMELLCEIIPKNVVISVDTQYREVAQVAYELALKFDKKIMINDVSCLKTDPTLEDFLIENNLPSILMASRELPGDLLTIEEIIDEFTASINKFENKGYSKDNIILDPGIGKWVEKKTPEYDLKIIANIEKLRVLECPILVAISRKSFIGALLNKPNPEDRLNGTLSATVIAVFNGAHIIRTHDVNSNTQLFEMVKMAKEVRKNK